MSKTTAISIILGSLLLITGALVWWYLGISKENNSGGSEEGQSTGTNFFPFGSNNEEPTPGSENSEEPGNTTEEGGEAPVIREISSSPVAGFMVLTSAFGTSSVRYIEQETGNVYEAPLETISKKRLTNTTIPEIRNVLWFPGGNSFVARYLGDDDVIESFSGTITLPSASSTEGEGSVGGKFLPRGIYDLSLVSPKESTSKATPRVFYLTENTDGTSSGYVSDKGGEKSSKIFTSPFKEWVSFPTNEQTILLQTKASGVSGGYLFSYSSRNQSLQKLIGPIRGLSVLPNKAGTKILFSEITENGTPKLSLYDTRNNAISRISLSTLAEKCTWGGNENIIFCAVPEFFGTGTLPDDWYKGKLSFVDSLWQITVENLQTKELAKLSAQRVFIDTDQITVNDKNSYVLIRNKGAGSLWSVRVSSN